MEHLFKPGRVVETSLDVLGIGSETVTFEGEPRLLASDVPWELLGPGHEPDVVSVEASEVLAHVLRRFEAHERGRPLRRVAVRVVNSIVSGAGLEALSGRCWVARGDARYEAYRLAVDLGVAPDPKPWSPARDAEVVDGLRGFFLALIDAWSVSPDRLVRRHQAA